MAPHEVRRNRSIIVGQVAPDEIDNQARLAGGKELAAHFERQVHVVLEGRLRIDDRAHRRGGGFRRARNQRIRAAAITGMV